MKARTVPPTATRTRPERSTRTCGSTRRTRRRSPSACATRWPRSTQREPWAYLLNTGRYVSELARLDSEYRRVLGGFEPKRVVAFHNSFAYLARRYGIEIVGLVEESPGREADAAHMRALIDRIRALGVKVVLVEPQLSAGVAEAIARDSGARVVRVDPLGDPGNPARATYVGLMRSNLDALVEGLRGFDEEGGGE